MKTKRFAVFGSPIIHSFSPQIFHHLFEKNNIDWKYNKILTNTPKDVIKFIEEFKLCGANITAPLKNSIIPYLTSITDDSKQINAVNTIIIHNDKLFGFNTDYEGVVIALLNYHFLNNKKFNLNEKKVLIIGAGNAASAAIYGIKKFFPYSDINIFNYNIESAKKLAINYNVNYLSEDFNYIPLKQYDLIIITIPNPEKHFINIDFPKKAILFFANYTDINYFKKLAAKKINLILGNEWLKEQAISAFEYYFGYENFCKKITVTSLQISKEFERIQNKSIFLTGFSGAGKTFIGEKIAKYLNRPFYDLDKMIEEYLIDNIATIFKNKGEDVFRYIEKKLLLKLKKNKCVVALGGGTITSPQNIAQIKKGFVIYLWSDLKTLLSRIDISTRPMLTNKTYTEIEELFQERKFIYFDNSDIVIENDGSVNKIIEELATIFKK